MRDISIFKNMLKEIDGPMCSAMDHGLKYFEGFYSREKTEIKYPDQLLGYAISRGYTDIVAYLVYNGIEINTDHLDMAVYKPEIMRIFCDKYPTKRLFESYNMLSTKNFDECAAYLSSFDSLHESIDEFEQCFIELAIILGRFDIVQYIVDKEKSASVTAFDVSKYVGYISVAAEAKQGDILYYFLYMMTYDADVHVDSEADSEAEMPDLIINPYFLEPPILNGCADVLNKILTVAEDASLPKYDDYPVLHIALFGESPLLEAFHNPSLELVKILIEKSHISPSVTFHELPALFFVIAQGSSDIAQYFFDLSVGDDTLFNDNDKQILQYAIQGSKQLQCLSLLTACSINHVAPPSVDAWRNRMLHWINRTLDKNEIIDILCKNKRWLRYDLETLKEFYKYFEDADIEEIALNCLTMLHSGDVLFEGFEEKTITSYVEKIQYLLTLLSPDAFIAQYVRLHPKLIRWESRKEFLSSIDCFHKASSSASGDASAAADETGLKELLHDWRLTEKIKGKLNYSERVGQITSFFYDAPDNKHPYVASEEAAATTDVITRVC